MRQLSSTFHSYRYVSTHYAMVHMEVLTFGISDSGMGDEFGGIPSTGVFLNLAGTRLEALLVVGLFGRVGEKIFSAEADSMGITAFGESAFVFSLPILGLFEDDRVTNFFEDFCFFAGAGLFLAEPFLELCTLTSDAVRLEL